MIVACSLSLCALVGNTNWIAVETLQNRHKIDRDRFAPVCGHRPGHGCLGFVRFGGRLGAQIDDFRPGS